MEPIQDVVRNKLDQSEKTKVDLFVSATSWLIGLSVGFTVNAVLKQNVDTDNKRQEVELYVGSAAISWVTKEVVKDKVEKRIYEWIDEIKEAKAEAEAEIAAKHAKG